jgi:hypothetical protein
VYTRLLAAVLFGLWVRLEKWWHKALLKAPVYGLLLGIGVLGGGGGDPGFALPVPIIPIYIEASKSEKFNAAVLPFVVFTLIFFIYESIKYGIRALRGRKRSSI